MLNIDASSFIVSGIGSHQPWRFNRCVDIAEIRRSNLKLLARDRDAKRLLLDALEMSPSQWSQIAGKNPTRQIGNNLARKIERTSQKPHGWLDQKQSGRLFAVSVEEDRADYTTIQQEIIKSLKELPPGMQQHLLRKVIEIKSYIDELPAFIRSNLKPPQGEDYYQWERDLETDMARLRQKASSRS